ncbi:2-oxoacid:acceptor oxidoreductase family protein [Desulfobacterales bacterium HSG2]|nr:2-oxoacid:acceptor oxidoreductase family protein [Desulfobacterales bacterium HSG2]
MIRSNLYTPDHVVVQDVKLLRNVDVTSGLKPGGWVLLNAPDVSQIPSFENYRLAVVDATQIALEYHLGTRTHPIINTAMIGAFARIMEAPSMDAVAEAIEKEIPVKTDQNIQAAKEAYRRVESF